MNLAIKMPYPPMEALLVEEIPAGDKKELLRKLKPLIKLPGFTGNALGGPSRWSNARSGMGTA